MPDDFISAFAFIETGENRPAIRSEIDARGITRIARHCLPEHGKKAEFLRQSVSLIPSGLAAVS